MQEETLEDCSACVCGTAEQERPQVQHVSFKYSCLKASVEQEMFSQQRLVPVVFPSMPPDIRRLEQVWRLEHVACSQAGGRTDHSVIFVQARRAGGGSVNVPA